MRDIRGVDEYSSGGPFADISILPEHTACGQNDKGNGDRHGVEHASSSLGPCLSRHGVNEYKSVAGGRGSDGPSEPTWHRMTCRTASRAGAISDRTHGSASPPEAEGTPEGPIADSLPGLVPDHRTACRSGASIHLLWLVRLLRCNYVPFFAHADE